MNAQPQLDTNFINVILNTDGKKTTDFFHLNRLKIAIDRLEQYNFIEGLAARADYLNYINEKEEALIVINNAIQKFGSKELFFKVKFKILVELGYWKELKATWEEFFSSFPKKIQEKYYSVYLADTILFLDNDFINTMLIDKNLKQSYLKSIQKQLSKLEELCISLNNYRKILQIAYKNIYQHYNLEGLEYLIKFKDDILQIIITSEFWDNDDIKLLYQEVNEAILAIDDVDFQIEADNIEVIFINFPIENLPQDFRLDDDDDSDLIDIVSKRMQNPEEEMVKIEVENA